ncbi:MAG: hypothetical protein WC378_02050 [Opitutaceae bacterium]|jgi:hypothetical protein
MIFPRLLIFLLGLLVLAGCSTIENRIRDNAAEFASLDQRTQERIKSGVLEVGYTERMAFMVLGAPDEKTEKRTAKGIETTWIYLRVRDQYAGSAIGHYRRVHVRDPKSGEIITFLRPEYVDVYQRVEDERLRVIFQDGKVSAFEQEKKR